MEIRLGIMVADVPYQPGDKCDNRGNSVNSRLGGRGMHTLGKYDLVRTLMSSLNGCLKLMTIYYC